MQWYLTNRQQLSMFYTFIDHKECLKMFKTMHLSFEHFDVFSVVDKSVDRGKLWSICYNF